MYDRSRPITNLFTAVKDYKNMSKASGAPNTPAQLVNIGLPILTHSTLYSSDISKWYEKPEAKNTWPNSKLQFKVAQKSTEKIQPVTTTDSLVYHDN